jgi:uncharacterized protein YoxC
MAPLAQAVIVACVVLLTAALVSALSALKKTASRAENVLHLIEREIRPLTSQIDSLAAELRSLARHVNEELERVHTVVARLDDASVKIARFVGVLGGLTRVGQVAGVATGVKRGLDVFIRRLKDKN